MSFRTLLVALSCLAPLALFGCSCSEDTSATDDDGGAESRLDGTTAPLDAPPIDAPGSELCPDGGCACSNGLDDDGDGLIDGLDPECTGPFDDDEGSFATGIPGDNRDPIWQDCFYDGNSGAGDDGCRYHTECLTGEREASDPDCEVSAMCLEFCRGRTPNGCDCFGCCDVTLDDGSSVTIAIGDGCSLDNIEDETACPPCVQDNDCNNECGTCELCPGREASDLPPECYDNPDGGTPMYTCDDGVTCMSDADCAATEFCSLGCCLEAPI